MFGEMAQPSTPMTGPSRRRLGIGQQSIMPAQIPGQTPQPQPQQPVTDPSQQPMDASGYVIPARPETLALEADPMNSVSVSLARRRVSPEFGRRRL